MAEVIHIPQGGHCGFGGDEVLIQRMVQCHTFKALLCLLNTHVDDGVFDNKGAAVGTGCVLIEQHGSEILGCHALFLRGILREGFHLLFLCVVVHDVVGSFGRIQPGAGFLLYHLVEFVVLLGVCHCHIVILHAVEVLFSVLSV